jgi:RIO kinase 1
MKTPPALASLIEDGVIDEVVRSLKSGKEASVYVVRAGAQLRCAKVYKNMSQRSFQRRAQYQEGRRVRGSRQNRAIGKRTGFGRAQAESAWKNAEVEALYRLMDAGVRVPKPHAYVDGVLVMEFITDAHGRSAPSLGEVELTHVQAADYHRFLVEQVRRMLCAGLIHGDLSEYNVLVGEEGPVIIDLPQAVSAAGNNSARTMLLRDVANVTATLARFAPELAVTRFGEELWALFETGKLHRDSTLTGTYVDDEAPVDIEALQQVIEHARDEAERRQRGREVADGLREAPLLDDDAQPPQT